MKTTLATVHLILRKNKILSDGTHPIMLRVSWHGMKEKATGWSCSLKQWDSNSECVKKGFPNFVMVNTELMKLKQKAISVRDSFISEGVRYTPIMVIEKTFEQEKQDIRDLKTLSLLYCQEKGVSKSTCVGMASSMAALRRFFNREMTIDEITEKVVVNWGKWLIDKGIADSTIRGYMSKVIALLHWAVDEGIINRMPVVKYKYHKVFKEGKSELYIHSEAVKMLYDIFLTIAIDKKENGMWSWREETLSGPFFKGRGELFCLYFWLLGYYLKGLAPVDILSLKKEDIKTIMLNGEVYYAVDGNRVKTRERYKIRVKKGTLLGNVLIKGMLMFGEGKYFLPCLKDGEDVRSASRRVLLMINRQLPKWWKYCNQYIYKRIANGESITPIDERCRVYSFRHSFLMAEIQKPQCNFRALAMSMGKSVSGLPEYISQLNDDLALV